MEREWSNWSGSLRFTPGRCAEPEDEDSVRALVEDARQQGTTVRPVGSGHSSSPLVQTTGILLNVRRLSGVLHHDAAGQCATIGGGTTLRQTGPELYDAGLAMDNLGDIDLQTVAGATATGTHGTGVAFGNLSTQIAGLPGVGGFEVGARRVRHVRINDLIDPEAIRLGRPYGCLIQSSTPIVVQFTRQDTRVATALAVTSTIGFPVPM